MNPATAGLPLTDANSAAMVELCARFYGHDRTTATTYINDNVVVCITDPGVASELFFFEAPPPVGTD